MGVSIYIGEISTRRVDHELEPLNGNEHERVIKGEKVYFDCIIPRVEVKESPVLPGDEVNAHKNWRIIDYWTWGKFCRETDLKDLFENKKYGLLRNDREAMPLTQDHVFQVQQAMMRWEKDHPGAVPGFGEPYDPMFARLVWFEWWMRWATTHCECPGIYHDV